MQLNLTVLAKSDKHTGYCVAAIDPLGRIIRLVRDKEGHALTEEQCKFKKLDRIVANVIHAPLKHQKENYILIDLVEAHKASTRIDNFVKYLHNPPFIFSNTDPSLDKKELAKQKSTFSFVAIDDLIIYRNDEDKHKVDFIYNDQLYKGFSITDPEFKARERKIAKAIILVSLPDAPYARYGHELYYKFICAVYPIKVQKGFDPLDCFRI